MKKNTLTILYITLLAFITNAQFMISAHRGNSSEAPENTLIANQLAIDAGADFFECDVRRTKDHVLVTLHDATLNRTTNSSGRLQDKNYRELSHVSAGYSSRFGDRFGDERIPTLMQVLTAAKGKIKVEIEIKEANLADDIVKMVQQLGLIEEVIIISFDFNELARVKALDARIPIKYLIRWNPFWGSRQLNQVLSIGGEYIGPYGVASRSKVDLANSLGVKIISYTLNSERDIRAAINSGQHGIATDYPARAIAIRDELQARTETSPAVEISSGPLLDKEGIVRAIVIAPNPTSKTIRVTGLDHDSPTYLTLLDISGKELHDFGQVSVLDGVQLPESIKAGNYLLNIIQNNWSENFRIRVK